MKWYLLDKLGFLAVVCRDDAEFEQWLLDNLPWVEGR